MNRGSHQGVRRAAALLFASGLLLAAAPARAEVTSWLAFGGGFGFERNDATRSLDRASAFSTTLGVGSSPTNRFVVGGVVRSLTHFSLGTDVSLSGRFATGGFARGDWGVALDAGVVGRFWTTSDYGSYPLQVVLTGGAPWGLQAGIGSEFWNIAGRPSATGFFAVLESDLLRLTVDRQGSSEAWWKNPAPAGGHITSGPPPAPPQ